MPSCAGPFLKHEHGPTDHGEEVHPLNDPTKTVSAQTKFKCQSSDREIKDGQRLEEK